MMYSANAINAPVLGPLDRLRPPGWQSGMPSPATTAREKAIAYARQVLAGSGDENVVNLASQYLRILGLSKE